MSDIVTTIAAKADWRRGPKPRQRVPAIKLPDGDTLVPRKDFADEIGEDQKTTRKRNLPTTSTKRCGPKPNTVLQVILKSESAMHALCKHLADNGGSGFTHSQFDRKVLEPYARNKYPALRLGTAIAKVLSEEREVARAYSAVHSAYYPAYAVAKAQPVVDDDDDEDDADALEELERLAEQERRRTNGMTKAAAFSKVYCDPANARLAQRERTQNRPR
jgi:hypothetical protein